MAGGKKLHFLVNPKKIVWHYHGDELRESRKMVPHHKGALFLASTPNLVVGGNYYDKKPDEITSKLKLFPNPVDTDCSNQRPPQRTKFQYLYTRLKIQIGYCKREPLTIEKYLEELRAKGYKFDYRTFDVKHSEMPKLFSLADIILDQVLSGFVGHVGLEAVGMGKPVMCEIKWTKEWLHNEDLFFHLTDIPDMLVDENYRLSKVKTRN